MFEGTTTVCDATGFLILPRGQSSLASMHALRVVAGSPHWDHPSQRCGWARVSNAVQMSLPPSWHRCEPIRCFVASRPKEACLAPFLRSRLAGAQGTAAALPGRLRCSSLAHAEAERRTCGSVSGCLSTRTRGRIGAMRLVVVIDNGPSSARPAFGSLTLLDAAKGSVSSNHQRLAWPAALSAACFGMGRTALAAAPQ